MTDPVQVIVRDTLRVIARDPAMTVKLVGNTPDLPSAFRTFLNNPTSANLAAFMSDETGTGALVFGTSPAITFADGSAAAPSITFSSNPLMGFFRSNNTLAVALNGESAGGFVRVSATDFRIRIGNPSPANVANASMLDLVANTSLGQRSALQLIALFSDITDATRSTLASIATCNNGTLGTALIIGPWGTPATAPTNGAFVIAGTGGLGVGGSIVAGGNITAVARLIGDSLAVADGVTAPTAVPGYAILFVDTADGDLKVRFGDGTVKTIVVDT